jgi:acyl-CoA thioesterase I
MLMSANRRAVLIELALLIPAVFGLVPSSAAAGAQAPQASQPSPQASQPLPQTSQPLKIVALGDSLTAGYLLPADQGFTAVLEKALRQAGHNVTVVNAGVSGDTAAGGLARLDWALADGADGVILELGANDMLRGMDPNQTRRALEAIMDRLAARKIKVLIAGMRASPSLGEDYRRAFDQIYPDLATKYKVPLYPFFLQGVATDRSLTLPDGLHPNPAGVARIVAGILSEVESFLHVITPPS